MGKAATFLTMLIFIDMLFIMTGQICAQSACSLSSIIFNAILNIGNLTATQLFTELIGDALNLFNSATGFASLIVGGGVIAVVFAKTAEFRILLIPVAFTLALIAADFTVITSYLISLSPVWATVIMAPLSIIFVFTVLEWLRGTD